ncbi:MAG: DUF3048 domain-containing protein [Firmicutes bacterium]|nr:DUF3048 domain-containing protein [Bacillota bacterium]
MKKRNIQRIIALLVILAMAFSLFALTGCKKKEEPVVAEEPEPEPEPKPEPEPESEPEPEQKIMNPLTGLDIKEEASGKRIVAIVVENSPDARPQWGMDDEEFSPDIILEGEVEYGITRTLWFYADYTSLPETIGPTRSARPPFVRFSELFDSIFIHWGQSGTTSDYQGADSVISQDGVNNINQMAFRASTELFGRSSERNVALEHTGILFGANLPAVIAEYGYRDEIDPEKCSVLEFNEEPTPLSETPCNTLQMLISGNSWLKTWTYSEEDKLYHTDDFNNNLTRDNLLVLFDTTEYIHKSSGNVTYCNYTFSGGEGKLASLGTVIDIKWSIEDGKLVLKTMDDEIVKLNPGKTWIGWGSSNYNGQVTIE